MAVAETNGTSADVKDVQKMKQELDRDSRDVSDLWNDALKRYKGIVGVDLQAKFTSVDAMIVYGTEQMQGFHKFRHDQKKVDKLRSLFAANMSLIQTGAQQLIAAATPAFPPAAAIGTAFTYMLSACKQVSADYDVVTAFFEDMNAFLQRISILESRLPSYPAYRNCLMDVFTSLLEMCGFATKFIELGRFKKWIINLMKGEDSELGGARKKMDVNLSRLQAATEYAILGNTEEIQRMNADLQKNQDLQLSMAESQTRMLETVLESQDNVRNELQSIQKLLVMFDERRRDDTPKQAANKAASQNKPPTSNRVRSFFPDTINPDSEYRNIKDNFIPDTAAWIFSESAWSAWSATATDEESKAPPRILAISGPPGSGKSHLAVSAYDNLLSAANSGTGDTAVAHFFFRETTKDLNMFYNAVNWIVVQLAEQNTTLCEKINVELAREDIETDVYDWEDVWATLVKPFFPSSSKTRLQIVLDGLDELAWTERDDMFEFLKKISESKDVNIGVVCTTRSDLLPKLVEIGAAVIEVTKEKQSADLKALIWHHLNNDNGFRKFARYMKQRISTELEEKADGMLYAENMLRQFNRMAREPLILKHLATSMPENIEKLYENILDDLQHRIKSSQHSSLKILLAWLAFSREPLTLNDSLGLLKLLPGETLDLEEELQGQQLSRLLKIAGFEERSDDYDENSTGLEATDPDSTYDDGDLPLKFQERSMRGFFRGAQRGEAGLRTYLADAHRLIFTTCSDIICGKLEGAHESLQKYAATSWAFHLSWAGIAHQAVPEEEKIAGLEALGQIMSREENGAAKVIESSGYDYKEAEKDFKADWFLANFQFFAKEVDKMPERFTPETAAWAKETAADKAHALIPLARAHVARMFEAREISPALRSYRFALTALKRTSLGQFIKEESDDDESVMSDEGLEDQGGNVKEDEILGIVNAFPDLPKDANAHWVIAAILHHSRHYDAALKDTKEGLTKATNALDKFRLFDLSANVSIGLKDGDAAYESVKMALEIPDIPRNLGRKGLITRAMAEVLLLKLDDSIASFEAARLADPGEPMPGDVVQHEFEVYRRKNCDADTIAAVKRWNPLEKLTFMTWKYDVSAEHHEYFRRVAGRAGAKDFLVAAYREVIAVLDRVDAGAPMRLELAAAYWEVCDDAEHAMILINEILDTNSNGSTWRFTNEEPKSTLVQALLYAGDILYEQFRNTSDRELKSKLFADLKGLTQKTLPHAIATQNSDLTRLTIATARMARKVGSTLEFQDVLQSAFESGYEALMDNVGWNDSMNLALLTSVLSNLKGLERESRILVSAIFSQLDPKVDDATGEKEEGDEPDAKAAGDEEPLATDEGDLSGITMGCIGECEPRNKWRSWKGRTAYQCTICSWCWLCEDCYKKRQAYNAGEPDLTGSRYCGKDHKYVSGPIQGWKGIKDGVITIEGEEPIDFKDWLADLKENKWKAAWDMFWMSED